MATQITAGAADTFETLARRAYGTELEAKRLRDANPGVLEPLIPGTVLAAPPVPEAPTDRVGAGAARGPNEVALSVGNKRFRFWDTVTLTRQIDALDTMAFTAPFHPEDAAFREKFRPFTFKPMGLTVGGQELFSGTILAIDPTDAVPRTVSVNGYSLPGVLNDCTPPASVDPTEFDGLNLQQIAKTLGEPFGVGVQFDAEPGAVFDRVAESPVRNIMSFLIELAKQRNLVVANTPDGRLLFQQAVTDGTPVAVFDSASPVFTITPQFDPQSYYSSITGIQPTLPGIDGEQVTVQNERLRGIVRPFTFDVPDTLDADLNEAVKAKVGRMFANMAAYAVGVSTWRDPAGALWTPNTLVKVTAPGAMIYEPYTFLIRSVEFRRDSVSETATLNVIIPGAFKGETPERLPWEE